MTVLFPELPELDEVVVNPTAADYVRAARYAWGRKKRAFALRQLSAAVVLEPLRAEHRALLEEMVATVADPVAEVPLTAEGTFFGIAACRAWLLARSGQAQGAMTVLARVLEFRPELPFLAWAEEWLKWDGFVGSSLEGAWCSIAEKLLKVLEGAELSRGLWVNLDVTARVLGELRGQGGGPRLPILRTRILRELGEPEQGLGLLEAEALDLLEAWVELAACSEELEDPERERLAREAIARLRPDLAETVLRADWRATRDGAQLT